MRMRPVLLLAALTACGNRAPIAPLKAPSARSRSAPAPTKPADGPEAWGKVYERSCQGSVTTASFDPAAQFFEYCGALFDVAQGHYRGPAAFGVLSMVSAGQVIRDTYSSEIRLSGAGEPAQDGASSSAGAVSAIALSPDRTRFVTLENSRGSEQSMLVLRELPSLRVVRRTPVSNSQIASHPTVGFLSDGREVVFAQPPCSRGACAPATLQVVQDRRLLPLSSVFDNARAVHVAESGDRAALVTTDGARRVVSLPEGKMLFELSALSEDSDAIIALSPDGKTVAASSARGTEIFVREGSSVRREMHAGKAPPEWFRFTPDSRSLFVGERTSVSVLRVGSPDRALPVPVYAPALPRGVLSAGKSAGEEGLQLGDASMALPELFAWYGTFNRDVEMLTFVGDPMEFDDARDPETWAKRILRRYYAPSDDLLEFHAWTNRKHEKSTEFALRITGGCEPRDEYVRAAEHDGLLYRVEVRVAPDTPLSEVMPYKSTFFDQPLGDPPDKRPKLGLLPIAKRRPRPNPC